MKTKKILTVLCTLFAISGALAGGYEITNIDSANTNGGLKNRPVYAIAVDNNGNAWFGYGGYGGGITRRSGTIWTTFTTDDGLVNDQVNDIAIDMNGHVWVTTNGGVSRFNGTSWINYTAADSGTLISNFVRVIALAPPPSNKIWFGTDIGISVFDGNSTWNQITDIGLPITNPNITALACKGPDIWAATDIGVAKFDGITWATYTPATDSNLVGMVVDIVSLNSNSSVWFAGAGWENYGLSHYEQGLGFIEKITEIDGTLLTELTSMNIDNIGNIWVGQFMTGLWKYDFYGWHYLFDENGGLISNQVNTIFVDSQNNVWVGTEKGVSFLEPILEIYAWTEGYLTCNQCDGIIHIEAYSGTPPFTCTAVRDSWSQIYTLDPVDTITDLCPGKYVLTITESSGVLDPWIDTIELSYPPSYLSGTVYYDSLPCVGIDAYAELYKVNPGGVVHTLVRTAPVDSATAVYGFYEIFEDTYLVRIINYSSDPNYENLLNTYYGDTYRNTLATQTNVGCNAQVTGIDINMINSTPQAGDGIISGTIRYIPYSLKSLKAQGDPVPGADIYIEQEPSEEPIAYSETDSSGYYEFTNLGDSLYTLYVDIPGLSLISTYQIDITDSNTFFSNINFYVDTLYGLGYGLGISTDSTMFINESGQPEVNINIFPNPYNDNVYIEYSLKEISSITIEIFDAAGRKIDILENGKKHAGNYSYSFNGEQRGTYFILFRINSTFYLKKIIRTG
ncbi:MAG: T9SS type A sorting domain-containing protein [Bacteroidia bacterium]|nr:T9SS type A sorting domain-containing protein [Bacteroidia bacterium]